MVQSLLAFGAAALDRIEIHGDRGRASVERGTSWDVDWESAQVGRGAGLAKLGKPLRALGRWRYPLAKLRAPLHEPSYKLSLERFVRALRGGALRHRT